MAERAEGADGLIRQGERLDDLQRGGLRILQRPDGFRFGMDSVLLAAFAAERPYKGRAVDLGTGSGILPLLLCARGSALVFDALEIQPEVADMAARSVRINGMESRIRVHAMDLRDAARHLGYEQHTVAVSNPPYGRAGGGPQNPDEARRTARHEGEAGIAAICGSAAALLRNGGHFFVIFPTPRLLELFDAMRAVRIEPKRVRLVHPRWEEPPNLALVEGIKAAKPMLHFLPPLYVRDAQGDETEALRRIYQE